jgi:hypothetical protein
MATITIRHRRLTGPSAALLQARLCLQASLTALSLAIINKRAAEAQAAAVSPSHAASDPLQPAISTSRKASLLGPAASNNPHFNRGSRRSPPTNHRKAPHHTLESQACRSNSSEEATRSTSKTGTNDSSSRARQRRITTTTQVARTATIQMLHKRSHSIGRDRRTRTEQNWKGSPVPPLQMRLIRCLRHHSKVIKDLNDE